MPLINVTESLVRVAFEDAYIRAGRVSCSCAQCQDDILAIALNRLPSRYVSTEQGGAFVKAEYFDPQLQSDVLRELALASAIVAQSPRHTEASGQ